MNQDLESLSLVELRQQFTMHKLAETHAKRQAEAVTQELRSRFKKEVAEIYRTAGKQHGDVSLQIGGVPMKVSISKRVEWDTEKLLPIMQSMNYDRATQLFDIKVGMPEKIYSALTDDGLRAAVDMARTVKYAEPKFDFVEDK